MNKQLLKRLKKFAPDWAKAIEKHGIGGLLNDDDEEYLDTDEHNFEIIGKDGKTHNLQTYSCCIVGETRGYDGGYGCSICFHYSNSLYYRANNVINKGDEKSFEQELEAFVSHYEQEHLKR